MLWNHLQQYEPLIIFVSKQFYSWWFKYYTQYNVCGRRKGNLYSLCKSFLSIHCNRPSAHLLSVEDIFLLSWQDAFNQETARAMSFPLLWYQSLYCLRCLPRFVWWFAWQPLIRDVRDVSDRQGPVVPWQGVQVGAPCKYLSTTWISQRRALQGEPVNLARGQQLELLLLLFHLWHTGGRSVGRYQE